MAKLGPTVAVAIALASALPGAAAGAVWLTGNSRGDEVLLERVLNQWTRPLYVATRAPRGAFGPLAPLTPAGRPFRATVAVDASGGAVAAFNTFDPYAPQPPVAKVAIRSPGGAFGAPSDFTPAAPLTLAANASGDAIVAGGGRYRFRPRQGELGPITDLPSNSPVGELLAVDPDGSAAYFWHESGQPYDDPSGFESVRPPGGEFGPPTPVADLPSGAVAVSDGRILVAWISGDSIYGAERPPGDHFGTPFKIADSPIGFVNSVDVAVAPSGAAAVAFGHYSTYVASRDPGGSFGAPQRVVGREGSVAIDDAGDVAAGWQRSNHLVGAAYRPHGGSFGKPMVLAAARPFAPGPLDPPAVVVDGAGKATAAWEQSNGAKVATFMRSFDAGGPRETTRVGVLPSFVREAPASACRPKRKSDLVTRSSRATVFWDSYYLVGCLFARGAREGLGSDDESPQTGSIVLAGPLVAHAEDYGAHSSTFTTIYVTDLRDPGSGISRSALAGPGDTWAVVPAIRLKPNGAVAFVEYPDEGPRRVRVKIWNAHAAEPQVVDSGRGIVPRSLELKGSRLTWRHGKRLRHATLR